MSSCWDVPNGRNLMYGHLPKDMLEMWAVGQSRKSLQYANGEIEGVSATEEGRERKSKIMTRLDETFDRQADGEHLVNYRAKFRRMFEARLEDPGLLDNFEYFDVPSSEYMIMFYISTWTGKMADVMILLHGYGWNLKGEFGVIPDDDVWYQMGKYEGMNISERIKVGILLQKINGNGFFTSTRIFSFGGGNEPIRLYLPEGMMLVRWDIFDDGMVRDFDELFPGNVWDQDAIHYYHENLFQAAAHSELFNNHDLGYMFGVSMYLGPELLAKAIAVAWQLLDEQGEFLFDLLLWTDSMRRVIFTQGWPKGKDEMFILDTVDEALAVAQNVVNAANAILSDKRAPSLFDIKEVRPILLDPWGVTSIVFTIVKCSV